ncbi:MAG: helix-turn-helix domain-containing protein [Candidatus Roseilinea sp.]|uniref:helix-turn-helix domain-containing protein n=1 Tax=Candidatus Roseilinea sp. TaxID=2838777 RepID=UPI00404A7236
MRRTSAFEALIADLEALDCDPRAKSRFRQLLAQFTGKRMWFSQQALVAMERQRLIARLALDYDRAELVRIIAERWNVSHRTAYRWVKRFNA